MKKQGNKNKNTCETCTVIKMYSWQFITDQSSSKIHCFYPSEGNLWTSFSCISRLVSLFCRPHWVTFEMFPLWLLLHIMATSDKRQSRQPESISSTSSIKEIYQVRWKAPRLPTGAKSPSRRYLNRSRLGSLRSFAQLVTIGHSVFAVYEKKI